MIEYTPLLFGLAAFLIAVITHEAGHYYAAKRFGYEPQIKLEKVKGKLVPNIVTQWKGKDKGHEFAILTAGVLSGTVPLFGMILFIDFIGVVPIMMAWIMYFIVIKLDAYRMNELSEELDENDM